MHLSDEVIATRMLNDWNVKYRYRFTLWMLETNTEFWRPIMKDLLERTFGPFKG